MQRTSNTGNSRDILASPWPSFLVFWLPAIANPSAEPLIVTRPRAIFL